MSEPTPFVKKVSTDHAIGEIRIVFHAGGDVELVFSDLGDVSIARQAYASFLLENSIRRDIEASVRFIPEA